MYKFDTVLGKLDHRSIFQTLKDGKPNEDPYRTVCFADVRAAMDKGREYSNDNVDQVKFYPWLLKTDALDIHKWAQYWVQIALSIPFVKKRVIEFTGFTLDKDGCIRAEEVDPSKYVLIDFTVPVDEPFVVGQLFRIPQECPGSLHLFAKMIESGVPDMDAWIASLYFRDTRDDIWIDGHSAVNGLDIDWWQRFKEDPSIAVSRANKFKSNVLGGSEYNDEPGIKLEQFLLKMKQKDLPRHFVAVYGSLRKGMGNHSVLSRGLKEGGVNFLRSDAAKLPLKMYDTGCGFPAVVPDPKNSVLFYEIYKVNDSYLESLDVLEGYPDMYDRTTVLLGGKPTWIYFQKNKQRGYKEVPNGNWVKHVKGVA